jgi:hypothetical protein
VKNKIYILGFLLANVAQTASCMDENKQITIHGNTISFDDNPSAKYASKYLRKISNTIFGTKIKKTTPCIITEMLINKTNLSNNEITLVKKYNINIGILFIRLLAPIPVESLIESTNYTINLPKRCFNCTKNSDQLIALAKKAEDNFEEDANIFLITSYEFAISHNMTMPPFTLLPPALQVLLEKEKEENPSFVFEKQIQPYIDRGIIISKTTQITIAGTNHQLTRYAHGLHGFGSPMQNRRENVLKLLMKREKNGPFKK